LRFQGQVQNWNDDKGFGFVEPNGGGERSFVHIKAFASRGRRPVDGDVITYQQVKDSSGRYRAEKITFASRAVSKASKQGTNRLLGRVITLLFCALLVIMTVMSLLPVVIISAYVGLSVVTFVVYALDKSAAKQGRWRTSENTLHLLALAGGWPGAFFAQNSLRHKSSKSEFKFVFWLTVIINLVVLVFLLRNDELFALSYFA